MAVSKVVTIAAKMVGGRAIEKEAEGAGKAIKKMGKDTEQAGKEAEKGGHGWEVFSKKTKDATKHAEKHHSIIGGGIKKVAGYAAGVGAAYGAYDIVKSSISSVGETAKEVNAAQSLGLTGSGQQTLQLLTAYKARGLGMQNLTMEAKTLAKATGTAETQEKKFALAQETAAKKGKPLTTELGKKAAAFKALGLNAAEFAKKSGTEQLKLLNERFTNLPPSLNKVGLATELLGRSGTKMLPLLVKGPLGLKAMEEAAKNSLPSLGGNAKKMEEMEVQSAKLNIAMEGLKLRIGIALMPVLMFLAKTFTNLYEDISKGKGAFGTIETGVKEFAGVLHTLFGNLVSNKEAMKALSGAAVVLGGLLIAAKIEKYVMALKNMWLVTKLITVATKLWTIVQLALLAVMQLFDVSMVVATGGLVLVAAGIYLVITHWKQFKAALVSVFNWIGAHWKLLTIILLGPIGLAIVLIVSHFKGLVSFVKGLPGKLASAGKSMFDWMKQAFKDAVDFIISIWNKLHFKLPKIDIGPIHVGGQTIGFPHIPMLAQGGLIKRGGSVIVGDRGPEVLSLPPYARVDPLSKQSKGTGGILGGFTNSLSGDLHVHVEINRQELAQAVLREFKRFEARA